MLSKYLSIYLFIYLFIQTVALGFGAHLKWMKLDHALKAAKQS